MGEIKLIVFDLWRTLAYKRGDYNHVSLREMIDKTECKIPLKRFGDIFEESVQTKKWENEHDAYRNMCKNIKIEPTYGNIKALINARHKVEIGAEFYVHVIPMLKKLKKLGYPIGLISNSSIFAIERIAGLKLSKYIDYLLFSFDVGVIKPDVKIYKAILKRANVAPHETIMIGDNLKNDVLTPRKLGFNGIHYTGYGQLKKDFKRFGINL